MFITYTCTYTLIFTKICTLRITNKISIVLYSFICSFLCCQLEQKFGHFQKHSQQQQYLIGFPKKTSEFLNCTMHCPEEVISSLYNICSTIH